MLRAGPSQYARCALVTLFGLCFVLVLYSPVNMPHITEEAQVTGWGVNVSRSVGLYVRPHNVTTMHSPPALCGTCSRLLVMVTSAPDHRERRNAIRSSWASAPPLDTKVTFLLGTTDNATLQEQIEEEITEYEDIVQEGFTDSYNNLTLKSVFMLKYVRHCPDIRYLMKTDDDVFVNLRLLIDLLSYFSRKTRLLLGYKICNARPILDPTNKWYTPYYMYQEQVFPNYLSGTGYVMSQDVVRNLYAAALKTPLIHLEDVYITGICAQVAGVQPRHIHGFSFEKRELTCKLGQITVHQLSKAELAAGWAALSMCNEPDARLIPDMVSYPVHRSPNAEANIIGCT